MIVGCYVLDLYCDTPDDSYKHRGGGDFPGPAVGQFTGETGGEARRNARAAGWKIDLRADKMTCPYCIRNAAASTRADG